MATAPFQLWLDLAAIDSAVRTSGTVTVTTATPHGITTGAYIHMQDASGVAGTSMNGVYSVTVTSGSTFTYTSSGTAGTGVTGSACISYDLLNPIINYSGTARDAALYVTTESLMFAVSGDGSGSSSSFRVMQDDTPADGPWFKLIPDQSRVRIVKANTGTTPAADKSDLYFVSAIANIACQLNGSGQGSISDVTMQDSTSLLDKLLVYSYNPQQHYIGKNGAVRSGGTVTITTNVSHGFVNGGTVAIAGVTGGGTAQFNEAGVAISNVTDRTFQFGQGGSNETGNAELSITSATLFGTALNRVELTMPAGSNLTSTTGIKIITGVTANNATAQDYINSQFLEADNSGTNKFVITLAGNVSGTTTFDTTNGKLNAIGLATPAGNTDYGATIPVGKLETDAVTQALDSINKSRSFDYALQRLLNTSGTSYISGAADLRNKEEVVLEKQTLRSVLDTIVETYQGQDGKARRYFVDPQGNLNYGLVDNSAKPTYATAPYKLITSGTQNTDTTTGAATLMPYALNIGFDHQTIKSGVPEIGNSPVTTYLDYGYAERKNSPFFDAVIPVPGTATDLIKNYQYARSFFAEAHLPLMSGYATIRGAGKAAHNEYGFSAGYAQTGGTTFALVNRWAPGQWVDITCTELGLSGLYRVEQVDWGLEPGSYTQVITITFSYKPQNAISALVKAIRQ